MRDNGIIIMHGTQTLRRRVHKLMTHRISGFVIQISAIHGWSAEPFTLTFDCCGRIKLNLHASIDGVLYKCALAAQSVTVRITTLAHMRVCTRQKKGQNRDKRILRVWG